MTAVLDAHVALRRGELDLEVPIAVGPGEVVAVLGPNGSGKSTALHAVAGLLALDRGRVAVDGTPLDDPAAGVLVPPERRPVSLVFQDVLLFPHLSALDNVAFGLRAAGHRRGAARTAAAGWLERLGADGVAHQRGDRLSGGEAQRVALARALAPDPRVLLLDEPLAALDAASRASVRRSLRAHLAAFTGATVLVTHDPLDALALAGAVVVVEAGRVTQAGPIAELTATPRSRWVADLVGANLLAGTARGHAVHLDGGAEITVADPADGDVFVRIAPAAVALHLEEPAGSPRNRWPATVRGLDLLGDRVRVGLAGPVPVVAEVTVDAVAALDLHEGRAVWASVKATEVATYPR